MTEIAGIQRVQGIAPLRVIAYGKQDQVLFFRRGLHGGESITIPKAIRKRVAYTLMKDATGAIVNRWDAPWEVED